MIDHVDCRSLLQKKWPIGTAVYTLIGYKNIDINLFRFLLFKFVQLYMHRELCHSMIHYLLKNCALKNIRYTYTYKINTIYYNYA